MTQIWCSPTTKGNSSSGPDNIPSALYKHLKYSLCHPLAAVHNQLISVGKVPNEWKTAVIIVPVFKQGTSGNIQNYRPISLTNVASKLMERIISSKILANLNANNLLSRAQHGFLQRRSTCTNLLNASTTGLFVSRTKVNSLSCISTFKKLLMW